MASKRKRSRPTRIAKADDVDTDSLPGITSYDEETLSRIQRYIEEGSEDTPDCLERKLEQCQTTDNVLFTEHENDFVDSPPMPENSNTVSTKQTKAPSQNEALESVELKFPNVANTHEWHMVQQRLRQADRRKNESHEQRQSRLSLNRQRQAWRRKNETQAERELRLAQGRERASNRRKNETEEERKLRLERHRLQQAERRKRESERERELRLSRVRQVQANRRKNESDEKREVRLTRNRLRQANRRKSESNNTCSVNFAQYQELIPDDIPTESQATYEKVFPESHTNGHIPVPSNLKFHQLLKDEVESLKRVTEAQELMSFQESEKKQCASKNKNMNEECSTRKDSDRLLSFKQVVAASKRAFGKRSKPSDDETPRYSCTMCKYVTNRSDHYKRHLMTHSADKPLKCTMCSYGTGRSDHYKRHLQRHGLSEHEIIETCFRNGLKLKNAAPSVSQVVTIDEHANKLKENVVEKSVKQESKPVVRGEKKHKCNQCSYSTDKSSHLKRHQLSHSKSTTSYCSKCNRTYKTPNYINNHKCFRTYGHRCPKCVQIFPDHAAMLRHIVDKHRNDQVLLSATKPVLKNITTDRQITDEKGTKVLTKSTTVITTVEEDIDNPSSKSKPPLTTDDQKPIDLSLVVPKREIVDAVKSFVQQEESDAISKKVLDDQSDIFVSNVPSNGGNMGCTKCGGWFNKLTEYSTHSCVS